MEWKYKKEEDGKKISIVKELSLIKLIFHIFFLMRGNRRSSVHDMATVSVCQWSREWTVSLRSPNPRRKQDQERWRPGAWDLLYSTLFLSSIVAPHHSALHNLVGKLQTQQYSRGSVQDCCTWSWWRWKSVPATGELAPAWYQHGGTEYKQLTNWP